MLKSTVLALLPAATLLFTSCSSTEPSGQSSSLTAVRAGEAGGVSVETYQETATVTGIDAAAREVTLVTPKGKKSTFKAGPEVVNFDQIRVGDQVKARVTEQVVVVVRKSGQAPAEGEASAVALAPVGAKPGLLMANTMQVTAKAKSIDVKHHKATLVFSDGTKKTFKVRKDVDLTRYAPGDEVVIRATEAVAISVEKP